MSTVKNNGRRIALVTFSYSIEVSPVLKNICSFLHEHGYGDIDVFVEALAINKNFSIEGINIYNLEEDVSKNILLSKYTKNYRINKFSKIIKSEINKYSIVFAADFLALDILHCSKCTVNIVFISLEGIDYMLRYDKDYVVKLLAGCKSLIVQSEDRACDIVKFLETNFVFEYLPVSHRPHKIIDKSYNDKLKLIYSGYFAKWACLAELLEMFRDSRSDRTSSLCLHGHSVGTEEYLKRLRRIAEDMRNVCINNSFYTDNAHEIFINQHDVGVAFYRDYTGTGNFDNLIKSSGKISCYLWNGLAILTNIRTPETEKPPFYYIEAGDAFRMRRAIQYVAANLEQYREAAYSLALNHYNFDTSFSRCMNSFLS